MAGQAANLSLSKARANAKGAGCEMGMGSGGGSKACAPTEGRTLGDSKGKVPMSTSAKKGKMKHMY